MVGILFHYIGSIIKVMRKDIEGIDDIKILVNAFYETVRKDEQLAPIFNKHIPGDWTPHLETMYRFWNAALFGVREYVGNPFMKHASLPIRAEHFEQWINIFYTTLHSHFEGANAEEAKRRAMIMARTFHARMNAGKVES